MRRAIWRGSSESSGAHDSPRASAPRRDFSCSSSSSSCMGAKMPRIHRLDETSVREPTILPPESSATNLEPVDTDS